MTKPWIAVATDFSSRSDRAVDRALMLGQERGTGVRVAHALGYLEDESANKDLLARQMAEDVGETACEIEYVYPVGTPPKAIASVSEADVVELLIMGPARYNSIGDYFVGTTVDYVLRKTTKPVLIVKQRPRDAYRHIIAGTDFSAGSANAIVSAARIFPDAQVHVVHAWYVPFGGFMRDPGTAKQFEDLAQNELDAFMKELIDTEPALAGATSALARGNAHQALSDEFAKHCKSSSDGLIVVGSHGVSGFKQATLGSVTSDLLRSLQFDVLVVNARSA